MFVLSLIYSHVAVCISVQCVVKLFFASICCLLITRLMFLNILFMFFFLFGVFVFYFVYSVFLYCFVYFSSFKYCCLIPNFVQDYPPLPPGGNPFAVNIVSYDMI